METDQPLSRCRRSADGTVNAEKAKTVDQKIEVFTLAEWIAKQGPPPTEWGAWVYDQNYFVLRHKRTCYEVSLDGLTCSAKILDWIAQVNSHFTVTEVGEFVDALDDILYLQGSVCGMGVDRRIQPRAIADKNGYVVDADENAGEADAGEEVGAARLQTMVLEPRRVTLD